MSEFKSHGYPLLSANTIITAFQDRNIHIVITTILLLISITIIIITNVIIIIIIRRMSSAVLWPRGLHQRRMRLQTRMEGKRMQYKVYNDSDNGNYYSDDNYDYADNFT